MSCWKHWWACRSAQLAFFTMNVLVEPDPSATGQANRVVFLYSLVQGDNDHATTELSAMPLCLFIRPFCSQGVLKGSGCA